MPQPPSEIRPPSFWMLQASGWLFYLLLNAVSSISYRHRPDYIAFRGAFLVTGFLASFLTYLLCHALWKWRVSLGRVVVICIVFCYPLGALCSWAAFWAGIHIGHVPQRLEVGSVLSAAPSGSFVLIAWCAFYFCIKHYFALEEKHRQLIESQNLTREAQLRALRYQLEPHFLFNTLNAISTLVLDNQQRAATQMISRLATLLRKTLEGPDSDETSLSEEISLTEEYLAIEEIRFGARLSVQLDVDPHVMQTKVPRLILQPLVENAIRHGIARRSHGGSIIIRASAKGRNLAMHIENELAEPGQDAGPLGRPGARVGLANVRKRLEKMYGAEGSLQARTNQRGNYEVSISLPLGNLRD